MPAIPGTWLPKDWRNRDAFWSYVSPEEFPEDPTEREHLEWQAQNDIREKDGLDPLPEPEQQLEPEWITKIRQQNLKFEKATQPRVRQGYFHLPWWVTPKKPKEEWMSMEELNKWERREKTAQQLALENLLRPVREKNEFMREEFDRILTDKGK